MIYVECVSMWPTYHVLFKNSCSLQNTCITGLQLHCRIVCSTTWREFFKKKKIDFDLKQNLAKLNYMCIEKFDVTLCKIIFYILINFPKTSIIQLFVTSKFVEMYSKNVSQWKNNKAHCESTVLHKRYNIKYFCILFFFVLILINILPFAK